MPAGEELPARGVELGTEIGLRWRTRYPSIGAALAGSGVACERRERGGLVAGLRIVSEYRSADDTIVLFEDGLAALAAELVECLVDCNEGELVDMALAHELFHRIHRRKCRRGIDAALRRHRAAEEAAAHAFAAAFLGLSSRMASNLLSLGTASMPGQAGREVPPGEAGASGDIR